MSADGGSNILPVNQIATNFNVASGAVIARLDGSDSATALGVAVTGPSPIIALCRALVARGIDPASPLEAWRDGTLAVRVRSVGEAGRLRTGGHGVGFEPDRECAAASAVAKSGIARPTPAPPRGRAP